MIYEMKYDNGDCLTTFTISLSVSECRTMLIVWHGSEQVKVIHADAEGKFDLKVLLTERYYTPYEYLGSELEIV